MLINVNDYRYCGNIDRHHASNRIYYVLNTELRVWYQKCHDPECKGYRSEAWEMPDEIWEEIARADANAMNPSTEDANGAADANAVDEAAEAVNGGDTVND